MRSALKRSGLYDTPSLTRHAQPWDASPIRVRAVALGPLLPHRDLVLGPDHALYLGACLLTVRDLLNDATIVQDETAEVTCFHVECHTTTF